MAVYAALKEKAGQSSRRRYMDKLHTSHEAVLHTMINVFTRGSYAQPHTHLLITSSGEEIRKDESFLVLEGRGKVITFHPSGKVDQVIPLDSSKATMVWIPAGICHTVIATSNFLVLFENKTGPWKEGEDKVFHPCFPAEGEEGVDELLSEWETLKEGSA